MPADRQGVRTRACNECRQQKLRCEFADGSTETCVRCKRLGIECRKPESFRFQRKKRQSKAEMQREIEDLRARLEHDGATRGHTMQHQPSAPTDDTCSAADSTVSPISEEILAVAAHTEPTSHNQSETLTHAHSIDGFLLESQKIDACMQAYFDHYHPQLPILDPSFSPENYYAYSPLLFWAMVETGSRRYDDDPTLLSSLATRVIDLAMRSLPDTRQYIPIIQSLLILCTWCPPYETLFKDPSPVLSGAAMALAVQHDLHLSGLLQEIDSGQLYFDRNKEGKRKQALERSRNKLWTYCKITCHNVSICYGLEPYSPTDRLGVAPSLEPRAKLHDTSVHAFKTLMRQNLGTVSLTPLAPMIGVLDNEILELESRYKGYLAPLDIQTARLHILSFHFFDPSSPMWSERLIGLHHLACAFIDTVLEADQRANLILYSTTPLCRSLILGAFVVLRVLRSALAAYVDASAAESRFLATIKLLKRRSLSYNDTDAKNVMIMDLLWRSPKALRAADGSKDGLKTRNWARGSFAITFDCYWWWLQEVEGKPADSNNTEEPNNIPAAMQLGEDPVLLPNVGSAQWAHGDGGLRDFFLIDDSTMEPFMDLGGMSWSAASPSLY